VEANSSNRVVPKFPNVFHHKSPSVVLHTESTTNIDSEESSLLYGGESAENSYIFAKHPGMTQTFCNVYPYPASVPPELETPTAQPSNLMQASPLPEHSHTRSYDMNCMNPINMNPYMYSTNLYYGQL
jgi:hypothetical protein